MAIRRGRARTEHGATAAWPAATAATTDGADRQDGLIQLAYHTGPDGLIMVAIDGDLDLATVDRTVRYVCDIIDRHDAPISADLSGLGFCDACGLGALIRIARHAEQLGRRLEFTKPSRSVARIMRITGVDDRLLVPALAGLGAGGSDHVTGHG